MAMALQSFGNKKGPIIVGIPGLLGGSEDFRDIVETLGDSYHFLIFDPNSERRELGLGALTAEVMQEIQLDCDADELMQEIKKHTNEPVWMCGISIGGKIIYDFSTKYPHSVRGAVITDVGLGSFSESELYIFVENIVDQINLNQPWPELKKDLRNLVSDDSLRSLIQFQLHYPMQKPPAAWKMGMFHFKSMLNRQAIDDQWETYQKVDGILAENNSTLHVMKATHLSAINEADCEKLKKLKSVKMHVIEDSSHFLQFTHKDILFNTIDHMIKG